MVVRQALARLIAGSVLTAFLFVATPATFAADDKADAKADAKPAAKAEVKKDRRGPLPFYYGDIVSPEQREQIYAIQTKYQAELAAAKAKLSEIETARNKEIEAVLTPEQLAKVNKAKSDAAAKRAATAKKPEGDARKPEGDVKKTEAPKADAEKAPAPKAEAPKP